MRRPIELSAILALSALVAASSPREARADDVRAAAQALFDSAMKLIADGAYDRACPQLEDVARMQPDKIGVKLELARCYEQWGKIASAWTSYRAAADAAGAAQDKREAQARAKVDELAARLPRLVISVPASSRAVPGLAVKRDERTLHASEWDTALPVDPGAHAIVASAPGKRSWSGTVRAAPGETTTLAIPALEDQAPAPPPPTTAPGGPLLVPAGRSGAGPVPDAATSARPPAWPWAVGGVGLAALAVGAGFGVDGLLARGTLASKCASPSTPCTALSADDVTSLNGRKDRGLAVFVGAGTVGVAGVVAAVVGLAARRATPRGARAIVVSPLTAAGAQGFAVRGAF